MAGEPGFHSNYISGMRIEASCGRYHLSVKVGAYCCFGMDQISNQSHCHASYELCIIASGGGRYIYDGTTYQLSRGDVIMADPGILHEIRSGGAQDMRLLYIFLNIAESSTPTPGKSAEEKLISDFLSGHKPHVPAKDYLLSYLEFIENYNNRRGGYAVATQAAVRNLVLDSLSAFAGRVGADGGKISTQSALELALDYIDQNLENKLLIGEVARYACTSQRNLEHLFRKNLGTTVIGYINGKKMDLAGHYLAMHFSIADTGRLVGVPDAVQFSRLFKARMGISPGGYRKRKAPDKSGIGRRA